MTTQLTFNPAQLAGRLSANGPYGLSVQEDGGVIARTRVNPGYIHRGIERRLEDLPYAHGVAFAERVDYLAAPACAVAFAAAVEKLAGIEVPPAARAVRVLLLELTRISSHLYFLSQLSSSVGHVMAQQFCLRTRERFCDLFELYCGSRLAFGAVRLGGVVEPATEGLLYRVEKALDDTRDFLAELDTLLTENPLFQQRLRGLAPLRVHAGHSYGVTGPNLRAAGAWEDLRFVPGYGLYGDLNMEPQPRLSFGDDAWGRYMLRVFEIEQSIGIISAVIRQLPDGNHLIPVAAEFAPAAGEAVERIEGPRGEIVCWLVAAGKNTPDRVKFATPSFCSLRMAPQMLHAVQMEDLFLAMASLDISISEVDR